MSESQPDLSPDGQSAPQQPNSAHMPHQGPYVQPQFSTAPPKQKKPWYKKWWIWLIVVLVVFLGYVTSLNTKNMSGSVGFEDVVVTVQRDSLGNELQEIQEPGRLI